MALLPICPRCEVRGVHGPADDCLVALRKAVATAREHYLSLQRVLRPFARNLPDGPPPTRSV